MAVIKCKMCGGDLNIVEGCSTAECEFCGSVQTIPQLDDEKKLIQFERAERLRKQCEFDKAAGIYETIVADFRQEAEAYWGLVLCKYGIEYVDDPATGKKIPTCHRSSFDSIMEDSDFEQVLENADGMARRVYREEAKAIEEIRKGIIAVSANEEPYDIFICYKETAENGDRTLDSVLAQDVYDALTEKGYRVFFSRITLEDKLGVEYEPYIFAALNSAKIMLVFGTDYEYFNAVWVKNEWSRFLKLMAKDKEKHLIPCFKGIDAYDMPKEFAKLQAQDLGKVGAMQDLMRGIDKILPRQTAQTVVVQERVVVGGGGDNKIASLLDRGNMALEDGDWAKADSFFEDVLNNDSKNAQAYLGKTLAQEQCRTMDAFFRKRKDATQTARSETRELQPNKAHIGEKAEQFTIPGFVTPKEIRKLYVFDLHYPSVVSHCKLQHQNELAYWKNHKQLSRAEQFATGAIAENLKKEKEALLSIFAERVKKAEEAEAAAIRDLSSRYNDHLQQADIEAEKLYNDGLARRDSKYQQLVKQAAEATTITALEQVADELSRLNSYQDSREIADQCYKRAAQEREKQAEEKRVAKEKIKQKLQPIRDKIRPAQLLISAGSFNTAGLKTDGTVVIAGNNSFGQCDVSKWKDIVAISARIYHTVGLKADGTVVAAGDNKKGQCDVANWKNIVAISAGEYHTVGLKTDGTVVAVGDNDGGYCNDGQCDVSKWKNIVAISAGSHHTVGLKADGTVVAVGANDDGQCDVAEWKDIVAISAGGWHTIGLKADGTVVAVGKNQKGQCDIANWKNIVAISAASLHTVGLKADGTVVAAGNNFDGQCNVAKWRLFQNLDNLEQERRRNAGRCQHCGGEFNGFFSKKCMSCGKPKDY